jgi:hypothetical protein
VKESDMRAEQTFEAVHATIRVRHVAPLVAVVTFEGHDVGEVGDGPLRALDAIVADTAGPLEIFIDARAGKTASLDVSGAWARWLASRRARLGQVFMLVGSPFIQLSAGFVRRFAEIGDLFQVTTDPRAFDEALSDTLRAR